MNSDLVIRVLTSSDVPALRGMLAMFAQAFDDMPTATFIAVAAVAGTDVIGGLAGYVL